MFLVRVRPVMSRLVDRSACLLKIRQLFISILCENCMFFIWVVRVFPSFRRKKLRKKTGK